MTIAYLFAGLIALFSFLAMGHWRRGLFLMLVIGVLQDPIRKITPETPAIMAISFMPIWLVSAVSFFMTEGPSHWRYFKRLYPRLVSCIYGLIICVGIGFLVIMQHGFGAIEIGILGGFSYIGPLLSILIGFSFVRSPSLLKKLLSFYCLITAVAMTGSALEYLSLTPQWMTVGTRALKMMWIRHISYGHMIHLMSGFYRSPDIMGWHAATLVMFSLLLALTGRGRNRWFWGGIVVWGVVCLLISGRNKMIFMPTIWVAVAVFAMFYTRRSKKILYLGLGGCLVFLFVGLASGKLGVHEDYFYSVDKAMGLTFERISQGGWADVWNTYGQTGFLGRGVGVATQGTQHVAGHIRRGWQEAGLSKLMAELGVLGFLVALLLGIDLIKVLWLVFRRSVRTGNALTLPYTYGLVGFVLANGASFVVSHQVYGDVLITLLTSFVLGAVLSLPLWNQPPVVEKKDSLTLPGTVVKGTA